MRLKRLQAEIHAERDALLESHKQKEQLFEFIVHDLKNPLTTIQLWRGPALQARGHAATRRSRCPDPGIRQTSWTG